MGLSVFIGGCNIKDRSAFPVSVHKFLLELSKIGCQSWPYHWHCHQSAQRNSKSRRTVWLKSQPCDRGHRVNFLPDPNLILITLKVSIISKRLFFYLMLVL